MKKFLLVPLMMAALTLPGFAEEKSQSLQTEVIQAPHHSKFLDQVLKSYQEGKYTSFLKRMDSNYQAAHKNWEYDSILEERKTLSSTVQDFESHKTDNFKKKMTALHEEENRELVDLCISSTSCPLTREIKDMVFFTPSAQEQESLHYISGLCWKFKGDGKTPLENKLIDIDTEFWLKSLSLDMLLTQNKIDRQTFIEQKAVLQLEKLTQMQLASQGEDVDQKIRNHIETVQKIYPKVQASSATRKQLHDLAIGKTQPQSPLEEKVKIIAVKYHEKSQEVVKEYFPEDQN